MGIVEPQEKDKNDDHTEAGDNDKEGDGTNSDGHEANDPQQQTGDDKKSKKKRKTLTICAPQLLHLGVDDGRPLWFNGWLLKDKYAERSEQRFAEVQSYITEPQPDRDHRGGPDHWVLGYANVGCLTSDAYKKADLSEAELEVFDMLVTRAKEVAMRDIDED